MTARPYTAKGPSCQGPALIKVVEVARMMGVSGRTVRRLADSGELPSIQLTPGCRRFRPDEVQKFISDREAATAREIHMSLVSARRLSLPPSSPRTRLHAHPVGNDPQHTAVSCSATGEGRRISTKGASDGSRK